MKLEKSTDEELKKIEIEIEIGNGMIAKGFILILILLGIEAFVGSLIKPFILLYLSKRITDNTTLLSLAYVPGGLLSVLFAPYLGKGIDLCGTMKNGLKARYFLSILSIIGCLVTVGFLYSRNIIQVTFVILSDFTVVRTAQLALAKIVSAVSKDKRGTAFGIRTFIEQSCNTIAPIIGGILWDYVGSQAPFWTSIVAEIIVAILYIVFFTWIPMDIVKNPDKNEAILKENTNKQQQDSQTL